MADLQKFWLSFWAGDLSKFEYHGPWWTAGYDEQDRRSICMAVMAPDEEAAKEVVARSFDGKVLPDDFEMRFVTLKDDRWGPFCDRFKAAPWMQWPWPGEDGSPRPVSHRKGNDR